MSTTIFAVVSGFCTLIQLVIYVVFLIVVATAVRSRRPDAWSPLAAGAATLLLDFLVRAVISRLLPMAMTHSGSGASSMNGYYVLQSLVYVVGTIISALGWGLMMIGVVRIASPPRVQNLNRAPGDY